MGKIQTLVLTNSNKTIALGETLTGLTEIYFQKATKKGEPNEYEVMNFKDSAEHINTCLRRIQCTKYGITQTDENGVELQRLNGIKLGPSNRSVRAFTPPSIKGKGQDFEMSISAYRELLQVKFKEYFQGTLAMMSDEAQKALTDKFEVAGA